MIETVMMQYLESLDVPVSLEHPRDSQVPAIVLQKTSGGRLGPGVYTSVFAVQCYGSSQYEAAALAWGVVELIEQMDVPQISACHLNAGPYMLNDPARKDYRYQIVYDLVHY